MEKDRGRYSGRRKSKGPDERSLLPKQVGKAGLKEQKYYMSDFTHYSEDLGASEIVYYKQRGGDSIKSYYIGRIDQT